MRSRLTAGLVIVLILTLCGCGASSASPASTPNPSGPWALTGAATIGTPADDGARIIKVDEIDTRTRDLTVESPAAGTVMVRLLLPASFEKDADATFPALYLIHGAMGEYTDWTTKTQVETYTAPTDLLVVMPAAGTSFLGDHNKQGSGPGGRAEWEPFHATELPQLMERNWRASDVRGVAGLSLGGYEAVYLAGQYPGFYKAVASYSGALDIKDLIDPWFAKLTTAQKTKLQGFADAAKALGLISLKPMIPNLKDVKTLFISYGNGTPGPLSPSGDTSKDPLEILCGDGSGTFVSLLEQDGVKVTVDAYGDGTHSWGYWDREFRLSLPLILEALGQPPLPVSASPSGPAAVSPSP